MPTSPESDLDLLKRFVNHHDEQAFARIVDRHIDAVYSVALRKTGSHHSAEDVTQMVFSALAKRAGKLRADTVLVAWLHRVATTEAAEAMRKHYKQRRTMAALEQDSSTRRQVTPDPDVYPELDEAIHELDDTDRNAILLRYAAGLEFSELGTTIGRSSEASRKLVSRAVEKLASILTRRGTAVPATTLAATLAASFNTPAPAALATTVSGTAISAAATPLIFQILAAMAQIKTKTLIAAAAIVTLGTTSFVAGRSNATSFQENLLATQQQGRPATRPHAPQRTNAQGSNATNQDSARILIDRAAAILRGDDDNAIAYYQAKTLLDSLSPADVPAAIGFIESLDRDDPLNSSLVPLLLGAWARSDGAAAMDYVSEHLTGSPYSRSCTAVLPGWARQDPTAAFDWFRAQSESGDVGMNITSFRWLAAKVFQGWTENSPAAAVGAFVEVPIEDERAAAMGIADAHNASLSPAAIRDAVSNLPPSRSKGALVEQVAKEWAEEEPQAAAAWLDIIPGLDPKQRLKAKTEVAEEWLRNDRSQLLSIGAWLISGTPAELQAPILEGIGRQLESDSQ